MNLTKICKSAKKSANDLASLSNLKRNKILEDLSKNLDKRKEEIFYANTMDLNKNKSLSKELKDRLIINEQKLKDIIKSIRNVKKLKDPLGGSEEYLRKGVLNNIIPHLVNNGLLVFNNHRNKDSFFEKFIRIVFRKQYRGMNLNDVMLMVKDYNLELIDVYSMGLLRDSFKKKIPFSFLYIVELLLGKFFRFSDYGYNQIYVFRKKNKK